MIYVYCWLCNVQGFITVVMKEKRNGKVDVHTFHIFFVKPSENRDRRNVWQATKHPPCKALFAPYQNSFYKKRQKN